MLINTFEMSVALDNFAFDLVADYAGCCTVYNTLYAITISCSIGITDIVTFKTDRIMLIEFFLAGKNVIKRVSERSGRDRRLPSSCQFP